MGNSEYLVRGAYLGCEYGTHHRRLNLPRSHGSYIKDREHCLMNAMDCKPGEGKGYNIPPFGICQSPHFPCSGKPILLKTETVNPLNGAPYRDENNNIIRFEDNVKGYRCEAVIVGTWQNTNTETLIGLKGETPYEALTTDSFLVCKYCGIIAPINSGQPDLDPAKADPEIIVPGLASESEAENESAEGGEGTDASPIAISVNGWLTGYSAPSAQGGRIVTPPASREELKAIVKKELGFTPEWYAPENVGGIHVNVNVPVDSDQILVGKNAELVDKEGKYWIAVGPNVMNPEHTVNANITPEEMNYAANIDVKLENIETGEIVYIYARVGDAKAHTGNGNITYDSGNTYAVTGDGIYQTGVNVQSNEYLHGNADASMVEFMVMNDNFDDTNLTNYRLIELIVYD
jgi:hypothetical protein